MRLTFLIVHFFLPHHSNNHRARILHPHLMAIISILFVLFQFLLVILPNFTSQVFAYHAQITPEKILELTNKEREKAGVSPLTLDEKLTEAAVAKATHMFSHNYWSHTAPDGTEPWYFFIQAGYIYRFAGENLARDFSQPEEVVRAWMSSPLHRENLLSPKYEDIGIAVVEGKLNGVTTTLVVQLFGTKMSRASIVEEKLANSTSSEVATGGGVVGGTNKESKPSFSISPFNLVKWPAVALSVFLIGIIVVDILLVRSRKIERVNSHSAAHLLFFLIILGIILSIKAGVIL